MRSPLSRELALLVAGVVSGAAGCASLFGVDFEDARARGDGGVPDSVESTTTGDAAGPGPTSGCTGPGCTLADASTDAPSSTKPAETTCTRQAAPGDLAVTEIMFQAPVDFMWIEIANTSTCRIDLAGVAVRSLRDVLSGGVAEMTAPATGAPSLAPGERVVYTASATFPAVPIRVHVPTPNAWLFTPYEVAVVRGATVLQKLAMPENFANTVRFARARPEGACAKVDPDVVSTWPLAQNGFQPNTADIGQTGTPGTANDVACPP